MKRSLIALPLLGCLAAAGPAPAQLPEEFTNLKVLPADIGQRNLIEIMKSFSMGLGVRCTFCHVGEEGQPLSSFDFASDEKAEKRTARLMLRMAREINETHLGELELGEATGVRVRCVTCHRGQSRPVLLQDLLSETLQAEGLDAAVARYRELRQRFYGSHTYDFSEGSLSELAQGLALEGKMEEALGLADLNLEHYPESFMTHHLKGEIYMQQGEVESAIESLERSLELHPENPRAKQLLEQLKSEGEE